MLHSDYALRRQIDRLVRNMHELQDHPVYNTRTPALVTNEQVHELQQIIRDTIVNIELLEMNRPAKKRTNLFRRIFRKK